MDPQKIDIQPTAEILLDKIDPEKKSRQRGLQENIEDFHWFDIIADLVKRIGELEKTVDNLQAPQK